MPNLPELYFAELDARKVEAGVITGFEAAARAAGVADFRLYDGDPRRLFLQALALMIWQQNAKIDETGKSNLLRFAGDKTIGDIGYLYGTRGDRLQPEAAVTTIEFTLSASRPTVTTIPQGTRLSFGNLVFATSQALFIPAGNLTGQVTARCTTIGVAGNNVLPGQIDTIVDRVPFVASAVNVTASSGGAALEELERYRERLRLVPESFSVAGPDGAYIFWALTASQTIIDVAVWMPTPGHVNIVPLVTGGEVPTQDIIDDVYKTVNDKTIRPLTDFVHVFAPTPVEYDIDVSYWIDTAKATTATEIQDAVSFAVGEYQSWQRSSLGRDIVPDRLIAMMIDAGARRVEVRSPSYTILDRDEVARQVDVALLYGGLENA